MSPPLRAIIVLSCSGCSAVGPLGAPRLVRPEQPRASYYNSPLATTALAELEQRLLGIVQGHLRVRGEPALRLDPALCRVAREYTRGVLRARRRPPPGYVDFLLHHAGVTEPHPMVFHASFDARSGIRFAQRFRRHLPQLLATRFTDVGLATLRLGPRQGVTVVLMRRAARLGVVPQLVTRGSVVPVRGRLASGFVSPTLMLTTPSGQFRKSKVTGTGSTFQSEVHLDDGPGRYTVEVLAAGPLGPTVVSLFPIYASTTAPAVYRAPTWEVGTPSDPRAAEKILLGLVNEERRRRRLPALKENSRLARVARSHSRDMVDSNFVGHRSPRTGTLVDRLRRARVPAAVSLENIARNETLAGAHHGLMGSPGHRRNILDRRVREIGIGVVFKRDRFGRQLYITQNYILPIAIVDPRNARAEVWKGAQRRRRQAGLTPLEPDTVLEAVAAATARKMLRAGKLDTADGRKAIAASLKRRGYRFSVLTASFFVVRGPREALDSAAWMRRGLWHGGVGVAQQPRSAFGDYALVMVTLLARRGPR